jgi:ABC-type branched-subunit amino acid transport system substrate-binding protein
MPLGMSKLNRGPDAVLAILGNVGTPTMVRAGPIAIETGTLFFGAFTGAATLLRDDKGGDCSKYIFNVRGSYAQEARATVEYFSKKKAIMSHTHFLSFDQNDAFGQAGYDGLTAAYKAVIGEFPAGTDATTPIARFRYTRNDDTSVPAQATAVQAYITDILEADMTSTVHTFGIMMTDTYGAGASFINLMRRWQYMAEPQRSRVQLHFSNVSFVGPNALADNLVALGTYSTPQGPKPFTTDVVVSQVVPNYQSDTSEVVTDYKELMAEAQQTPSFTSLEGYIAGRVFASGLSSHEGPFTPEALVGTFEALPDLSLGLGANAGFNDMNHQYSQSVWGTILQADGTFKNLYFWSQGLNIQFYE